MSERVIPAAEVEQVIEGAQAVQREDAAFRERIARAARAERQRTDAPWVTAPTASTCTTKRRAAGIARATIDTPTAWWQTELHSEAAQAALRYTEALTRVAGTASGAAFQSLHDALAEHFSREEILEIVAVVVNMNVWTRIKLAEGAMPGR